MDVQSLFKTSEYVYYIKLVNGDSVLCKSDDSEIVINEQGAITVFDAMKINMRLISHDNGAVSEVMMLAPWMDACDLSESVSIPIESIVAIAPAKETIARKYSAYVLAQNIKEASYEDEAKMKAEQAVSTAKAAAIHQMVDSGESDYAEPRKPELLSRERMMEAEMNGDIEDASEETHEEKQPHYRVGNVTFH
jgi:hypothetical protein